MSSELFIMGDPHWLSGGAYESHEVSYDYTPPKVGAHRVTSAIFNETDSIEEQLKGFGQQIHSGRSGYHHRPRLNVFLDDSYPSVGVELETEEKDGVTPDVIASKLKSNWFHFEKDASLATGAMEGYELITEPLPPRVYRNRQTWMGLQNILTPFLSSFEYKETGLHIHAGLEQFGECANIELPTEHDKRLTGAYMSALVYASLLNPTFVDRVMLRKPTNYCARKFTAYLPPKMSGYEFIDYAVEQGTRDCNDRIGTYQAADPGTEWMSASGGTQDHYTDLNLSHPYTIEFRRGKGTLHSLSIHRMIELTTLCVRYAWSIVRNPEQTVTSEAAYDFIINNTVNPALKQMAVEMKG